MVIARKTAPATAPGGLCHRGRGAVPDACRMRPSGCRPTGAGRVVVSSDAVNAQRQTPTPGPAGPGVHRSEYGPRPTRSRRSGPYYSQVWGCNGRVVDWFRLGGDSLSGDAGGRSDRHRLDAGLSVRAMFWRPVARWRGLLGRRVAEAVGGGAAARGGPVVVFAWPDMVYRSSGAFPGLQHGGGDAVARAAETGGRGGCGAG